MHIDHKLLALLAAATIGGTLIGCQREGPDERAAKESAPPPIAAAPTNRDAPIYREAPASTESPAATTPEKEKSEQPADQTGQIMKESGEATPDKTQR